LTFISELQGQFPRLDNIFLKPDRLLRDQFDISLELIFQVDVILEMALIALLFDNTVNLKVLFTASEGVAGLILASHLLKGVSCA